jgi:hypothetical protein
LTCSCWVPPESISNLGIVDGIPYHGRVSKVVNSSLSLLNVQYLQQKNSRKFRVPELQLDYAVTASLKLAWGTAKVCAEFQLGLHGLDGDLYER